MTELDEDLLPVIEIPGDEAEQKPLPIQDPPLEPGQEEPIVLPSEEDPNEQEKLPPIPSPS